MYRLVIAALLFVGVGLAQPATAQTASDLPARPVPFTFVTDQGNLLSAGDAKKLEGGLRSYAEKTGTQVVVVTVPTLGSRSVADYGRALGTAWGVGQRDKNNGLVVLIGAKEHKVTIQPGSGLASTITPAVVSRVINQEMTPSFKQSDYFGGLRKGLNTLMVTANPSSAPSKQATAATAATSAAGTPASNLNDDMASTTTTASTMSDPAGAQQSEVSAPASPGIGMGTLLIGALVIGGVLFFIIRMFRNKSAAQNNSNPNFYPNQGNNGPRPNQNPNQPNFYPNQGGGPGYQGGYPAQNQGGGMGSGMGGILATGAAAAAGAYIGNRMSSHGDNDASSHNFDNNTNNAGLGAGAAGVAGAAGTGAAGDYFSGRGGNDNATNDSPDYFSGNDTDNSNDYFSSDNSSYDDTSSSDTGGGGFDSTDDNSGSW